jgi:hypothetical protein
MGCNNTLGSVPTSYGSLYQGPGTNGLPSGQGLGSSVSGTTLQSPTFALAAGNTISFDINFGTNDGTYNFPDWAAVQLVPTLTGTPINATPMQSFIFNNVANNLDEYDFDYSNATSTITANGNATPFISDFQIAPSDWANVVAGTPFATTACIPIAGANGNCAQKKHVCTTPTIATQAGANCPQSSLRNILLSSTFDPVTTITNPGTIFGVVESNDSGACPYDGPAANLSCPSNGLVSFTGTGAYRGGKGTGTTNSRTVLVTGVLPPATTTTGFVNAAGWTNTKNATPVTGTLTANPPQNPLTNGMVVAPIDSISYGIGQGALPPTFPPISIDTTVFSPNPPGNASTCPSTITATTPAPPFAIPVNLGPLAEGTWLLHYQARDCGGTNELKFTRDFVSGNWSTNFQSLTINVDNKPPMISTNFSGPAPVVLNGPGPTLNFTCTDPPLSGGGAPSGIQVCGTSSTTNVPGPSLGLPTFSGSNGPLSTATIGTNHATVYTQDQAGNTASTIANYSVLYPSTGNCLGDPVHQIGPPINPNGSSVFSKPTTIYANFRVCDANGKSIGTPGLITNITVRITKNDITDSDAAEDAAALLKATTFHFDTTHQYWISLIGTSGLDSGYTYAFTLTLNDGSTLPFRFGVK